MLLKLILALFVAYYCVWVPVGYGLHAVGVIDSKPVLLDTGDDDTTAPEPGDGVAPAATVAAEGDCHGTNGNSAVAACHYDVPEIVAACPDNDYDGDGFAAPEDACLDAVGRYRDQQ